jgi:DNA-binding XRE family transcriptional regulator
MAEARPRVMDKKILEEEFARSRIRILEEAEQKKAKQADNRVREQLKAEGLIPISRRVFFRDDAKAQKSFIEAGGPAVGFQLKIFSSMPPQGRRTVAVSLIRSMKPILKYLRNFDIHHEGEMVSLPRLEARGLPLSRSPDLDTEQGRVGFEIRMKRLKIGWTQQELADRASMNSHHLSRIELGLVRVRPRTLEKINGVLRSLLSPTD